MRIIVIEDQPKVAEYVAAALRAQGYAVDGASNGVDGLHLAQGEPYDLVILDLGLPQLDGMEVLCRLRAQGKPVPVLVLTARDALEDRVRGLDAGADDYLIKPFALTELLARVRALLRRSREAAPAVLRVADMVLDPARRRVEQGGRRVELTPREFALLEYFMRNPGTVLSRTMISEHVWDYDFDHLSNVIDVHIRRLRAKLDDPGGERGIRTVRGVGYVLGEVE